MCWFNFFDLCFEDPGSGFRIWIRIRKTPWIRIRVRNTCNTNLFLFPQGWAQMPTVRRRCLRRWSCWRRSTVSAPSERTGWTTASSSAAPRLTVITWSDTSIRWGAAFRTTRSSGQDDLVRIIACSVRIDTYRMNYLTWFCCLCSAVFASTLTGDPTSAQPTWPNLRPSRSVTWFCVRKSCHGSLLFCLSKSHVLLSSILISLQHWRCCAGAVPCVAKVGLICAAYPFMISQTWVYCAVCMRLFSLFLIAVYAQARFLICTDVAAIGIEVALHDRPHLTCVYCACASSLSF